MGKLNDEPKTPPNRWLSSNDDPTFSLVKSKSSETLLNKPNEAESLLRPNLTSPTNDQTCFTLRTPLSSTRNERSRPNFNKPLVKSKSPSPNAETLKRKPRKPSLMPLSWPKLNKLPSRVARNRSRNSKLECENSKTNSMANNDEPPNLSKTAERSNER